MNTPRTRLLSMTYASPLWLLVAVSQVASLDSERMLSMKRSGFQKRSKSAKRSSCHGGRKGEVEVDSLTYWTIKFKSGEGAKFTSSYRPNCFLSNYLACLYVVYDTPCIVQCTLYNVHCTMYTVHCTEHCTLYWIKPDLVNDFREKTTRVKIT